MSDPFFEWVKTNCDGPFLHGAPFIGTPMKDPCKKCGGKVTLKVAYIENKKENWLFECTKCASQITFRNIVFKNTKIEDISDGETK